MTWVNRTAQLTYMSPSGNSFALDYEDMSVEIELQTKSYNYANANVTVVQQFGHSSRILPLRVFFSGPDYDIDSAAFEAALLERGTAILQTPLYGSINVVPTGKIKASDKFKTSANQRVLEIELLETAGIDFQGSELSSRGAVLSASSLAIEEVSAGFDPGSRSEYQSLFDEVSSAISSTYVAGEEALEEFSRVENSIQSGLTLVIGTPLLLASQTANLITGLANSSALFADRIIAYQNLARSIFSNVGTDIRRGELFAVSALVGAILSAVNSEFITRAEAVEASIAINDLAIEVEAFREQGYNSTTDIDNLDVSDLSGQIGLALSAATNILIVRSFDLLTERSISIDRERTIIDIAAEIFGSVDDDNLNALINNNGMSGDEILIIPKGFIMRYFV